MSTMMIIVATIFIAAWMFGLYSANKDGVIEDIVNKIKCMTPAEIALMVEKYLRGRYQVACITMIFIYFLFILALL